MRVTARRDDEQGATMVLVAMTLVVLIGFLALVVDLGDAWSHKRQLVTTTDAAALAAALEFAGGGNGCVGVASDYVDRNVAGADSTVCTKLSSHRVQVTVNDSVNMLFAPALGLAGSKNVSSTSIAGWGAVSGVTGLRPFGLCYLNDKVQDWLDDPTGSTAAFTITYQRLPADAPCGSAPGNWGTFDFDGGSNSTVDQRDWVENGYPGTVSVGDTIPGDTGSLSSSVATELAGLRTSGEIFALPLFSSVVGTGSTARLVVYGFLGVRLVNFDVTGPQAARSLTLEFHTLVTSGSWSSTAPNTGVTAVALCGVAVGDTAGCPD